MNRLEKEIESVIDGVTIGSVNIKRADLSFKDGTAFVISKNLPILFTRWLNEHFTSTGIFYKPYAKQFLIFYSDAEYEDTEIYKYWINNEYGK